MKFILASKSPRRKEILEGLGLEFSVITADTNEDCDSNDPKEYARELAERKALAVLELLDRIDDETIIIASDTIVECSGEILGKPRDKSDAKRMMDMLSGKKHRVVSGLALVSKSKTVSSSQVTSVVFDQMNENDKMMYISSKEPYDKAGGYAVQGLASMWISGIEGDYFNVVGLPVKLLHDMLLKEFNIDMAKLLK